MDFSLFFSSNITSTYDESCLPTKIKTYRQWYLKQDENIGEASAFGKVYNVCNKDDDDCGYVMKVSTVSSSNPREKMLNKKRKNREVEMQNKCASSEVKNICLKVEDEWDCDDGTTTVIITRLLKETLKQYFLNATNEQKIKMLKTAIKQIVILHYEMLIYHGDTHLDNFMITHDNKLRMIDLGSAGIIGFDEDDKTINMLYLKNQILDDYKIFLVSLERKFGNYPKKSILNLMFDELKKEFDRIEDDFKFITIYGDISYFEKNKRYPIDDPYCETRENYQEFYNKILENAIHQKSVDIINIQFIFVGIEYLIFSKYFN